MVSVEASESWSICSTFSAELPVALILVVILAGAPSFAANPDQGKTLAKRWCAGCHPVATDQKVATTEAPPFEVIAKRPDFDAAKIALFLLDPHPKMPNVELSGGEATDIGPYIAC